MVELPYEDRGQAGRVLGEALEQAGFAQREDVLVLGLPRGGVPVAYETARVLRAPMDVLLVRKLGVPGQEELAMGAIASGGARVINEQIVRRLKLEEQVVDRVAQREGEELRRREQAYRGEHPAPTLARRTVILIDDGLATGSTMSAAARALRQSGPAKIVAAAPVAPSDTCEALRGEVDQIICAATPQMFGGVGRWYKHFEQTSDEEVRDLLVRAWGDLGG